jgi:hypothetical protein
LAQKIYKCLVYSFRKTTFFSEYILIRVLVRLLDVSQNFETICRKPLDEILFGKYGGEKEREWGKSL